ncbi:phage terminase small subunit P27 family [Undibacterium sp. Ji50W]|uniref:phage terminase small subunit P27 family n=1 Tax=Undibacterium sp. Ji50W TaxID=3413041 RepID=UPI003BF3A57F
MGQRGPRPKPHELKVLEGNLGHRPIDTNGTWRPLVEVPDPPKYLGKEARKEWKRITVELSRNNIVAKLDQHMLGMLCQCVERLVMFETALSRRVAAMVTKGEDPEKAYLMVTATGYEANTGIYNMLNKEREMLMKLLGEFGLSPALRAKVVQGTRAAQLSLFTGGKSDDKPTTFDQF